MSNNRFAMLSMDDDNSDGETTKKLVVPEEKKKEPEPVNVREKDRQTEKERTWNILEGKPENTRQWNLEGHGKRTPFSRYAFRDEDYTKHRAPRTYGFRDDSPPHEKKKYVSPVSPHYPTAITPPLIETSIGLTTDNFPTLSDYNRPQTPPYPPDDGWYPTLAQRIRVAMERKEAELPEISSKKVINMDLVIPMPTRLGTTLQM